MTSDPMGDFNDAQGRELLDSDGQRLGQIREIFLDETTGQPAWAAVDAPGGDNDLVLAPLAHATRDGDAVRVAVSRQQVETSPSTTGLTERFSPDHMDRVRAHYADQPAGVEAGGRYDTAAGETSDRRHETAVAGELPSAMIRSEEMLSVQHERVPRERVRLVKRIVTETVTQTIEVRREELQLERVDVRGSSQGESYTDHSGAGTTMGAESTVGAAGGSSQSVAGGESPVVEGSASGAQTAGRGTERGGGAGLSALRARASSLVGKAGERFGGAPGFGEAFTNQTLDLTLYEEHVVVSKRVVPRERVRIHREVITEQQRISDELRKEQIQVERLGLDAETRVEDPPYRSDAAL